MGSGAGQSRYVYGNYGLIQRNDGSNYYLLMTASGDPYGGWNGLRLFTLNLATGDTTINGMTARTSGSVEFSGTQVAPGVGVIRDANGGWIRTYGNSGWYNETYGGGWHMADTTWIHAYGGKNIHTTGTIQGDASVTAGRLYSWGNGKFDGSVGIGMDPGYRLDVNGDIRANNAWLRSTGNTGWYNETYAGGWYMNDTSAVRVYNDKNIATGGWVYANTAYLSSGILRTGQRSNFFLGLQSDRNMCLSDNGAGIWCTNTYVSDMRLKKNVKPLENILPILKNLSIIRFNYKSLVDDPKPQIGVSAQELLKVFPEYVYKPPNSEYYIVNYDKLSVLSLKGVQELSRENEQLRQENADIRAKAKVTEQKLDLLIQTWCKKEPNEAICR